MPCSHIMMLCALMCACVHSKKNNIPERVSRTWKTVHLITNPLYPEVPWERPAKWKIVGDRDRTTRSLMLSLVFFGYKPALKMQSTNFFRARQMSMYIHGAHQWLRKNHVSFGLEVRSCNFLRPPSSLFSSLKRWTRVRKNTEFWWAFIFTLEGSCLQGEQHTKTKPVTHKKNLFKNAIQLNLYLFFLFHLVINKGRLTMWPHFWRSLHFKLLLMAPEENWALSK